MNEKFSIKSNLIDLENRNIRPVKISISNGNIESIETLNETLETYVLPGFIDAHVHIESSLLPPSSFARLAIKHGTIATVSDPHEIANVLGVIGVNYMLEDAAKVPFKFFFGAPSCVPATFFETAGAVINAQEVNQLLQDERILYLTEMMNYPGVIYREEEVLQKIAYAQAAGKPIDGHAPGLRGHDLDLYIKAGISTDHECFTLDETLEKLQKGMKVIIREGSAARNFDTLHPLLGKYISQLMFCSDDKHPDSLLLGHINELVVKSIALGYNLFDVLTVACVNPVKHYKLPVGLLRVGDPADFIIVNQLERFEVLETYVNGLCVYNGEANKIPHASPTIINNFRVEPIPVSDLLHTPKEIQEVIECLDGQLVTGSLKVPAAEILPSNDYLKIVVVNRYETAKPAIAYIKNFGLTQGAIASSVAHDSHNIIAVGVNDKAICQAINLIIQSKGGLSACNDSQELILPLPIAGLMSNEDAYDVADRYTKIDNFSKQILGASLKAPFMSLSFMALLVIPHLKLSDKGLFSGDTFSFVN
jgi:adenine deaminase